MTFKLCQWLFLLLVASLPIVRPLGIFVFDFYVPATDFIFVAVCVLWMAALLRRETTLELSRFYVFLGCYAAALTLSTVFSTEPERSFRKLPGVLYLLALAIVTFNLVREEGSFRRVTYACLVGTGLTVLASLAGFLLFYMGLRTEADNFFLSHIGSLPAGDYPRVQALFANPNMLANFLNVSLMLTVLAAANGWIGKFWSRFFQAGIWFAAVCSLSAGLGGMILSIGIWWWAVFRDSKKAFSKLALNAAIVAAVVIFSVTLISSDTQNTNRDFKTPLSERAFEPSVRVLVWENALFRSAGFPILGRGTGTDAAQLQYRTISGQNQILMDAHNVWLNILGQTGLVGLAAFAGFVFYLTRQCRFGFVAPDTANLTHLALSCAFVGAFLYQGLSGSFEDARHLWVLFGLIAGFSISRNAASGECPMPTARPST